jgi:membrane fusion protein, heavy metal efflux system
MKNKLPDPMRPRHGGALASGLVIICGFAALLGAGCSPHTEAEPQTSTVTASNVTLTAAQRQNIHLTNVQVSTFNKTIDATGTVQFDNDHATVIFASMSGPVSRLLVPLGEPVKEGQPLAEVDSPDFATAISTYRKALATAKITGQLADQDQELFKHHGVSLREAEQALIDATNAQADSEAALQQLVSLKVPGGTIQAIKDGKATSTVQAVIRSPIAGTLVDREITQGELLQAGTTQCFTVADMSRVWVMANVFGADLGSVSVADPSEVLTGTPAGNFSGTVENIGAVMDPNTRSVAVRVVTENPGGALKDQMYVDVRIHSSKQSTGVLIPVSAVLRNGENLPFVYVAQKDGSYARARIELGERVGDQYQIISGLNAGDQVVVEGGLFVQFLQDQ